MFEKERLIPAGARRAGGFVFFSSLLVLITAFCGCGKNPTKPNNSPTTPTITPSARTIESGGSVDLVAIATDPDGDALTYSWTATGGFFDTAYGQSVAWTAPTVTIPAACTVTVAVRDDDGASAANSVDITVNPTPAGVIAGTAFDEHGLAIPDMSICVRLGPSGPWLSATSTDGSGHYSLVVRAGTYYIYGGVVVGARFMSNDGTEQVTVSQGDTVTYDVDAKRGYFLELNNIQLNHSGTDVSVIAGQSVSVGLSYTIWSRKGCPGCIDWITLGIEEDGQDGYHVGIPGNYPGENGSANLTLTAPNTTGVYTVYGIVAPDYTEQDAIGRYESNFPDEHRFIPIGTINVE